MMIQAGLYEPGTDPLLDRAVAVWPALDAFNGRDGTAWGARGIRQTCPMSGPTRQALDKGFSRWRDRSKPMREPASQRATWRVS